MPKRTAMQLTLALALALSLPMPVGGWADDVRRQDRDAPRSGQAETRQDAAAAAAGIARQRNGGGRVLSVQRRGDRYRVKVIKDGEVRVHLVEVD